MTAGGTARSIEDRCAGECACSRQHRTTDFVTAPFLWKARLGRGHDDHAPGAGSERRRNPPNRVAACRRSGSPAVARFSKKWPAMIELPPVNIYRWTIRRKAAVVTAVAAGEINLEEVCRRYQISTEEFLSWQRAYESYGLPGLRSTRLQQYRRTAPVRGQGRRR
jgi:uncharacterized protein DUF1153